MHPRADASLGEHRRGGVLFEVMLAVALFVGAATFTLASVRSVTRTLERTRLQQEAVDFARSRMAELEAGLTTLGGIRGDADTDDPNSTDFDAAAQHPRWHIEVSTARSEFGSLTLVELTVIENMPADLEAKGESPMRYSLRQLVTLREDAGEPFAEDEIMRGLPDGGER